MPFSFILNGILLMLPYILIGVFIILFLVLSLYFFNKVSDKKNNLENSYYFVKDDNNYENNQK